MNQFFSSCREAFFLKNPDWTTILKTKILPSIAESQLSSIRLAPVFTDSQALTFFGRGFISGVIKENMATIRLDVDEEGNTLLLQRAYAEWMLNYAEIEKRMSYFEQDYSDPLEMELRVLEEVEARLGDMVFVSAQMWKLLEDENFLCGWSETMSAIGEILEVLVKKDAQYGQANRRHGLKGIMPRLCDKIARFTNLASGNGEGHFEPLEDSAKDLCGYSAISLGYILEMKERAINARCNALSWPS
jgi:hypothetical protein